MVFLLITALSFILACILDIQRQENQIVTTTSKIQLLTVLPVFLQKKEQFLLIVTLLILMRDKYL